MADDSSDEGKIELRENIVDDADIFVEEIVKFRLPDSPFRPETVQLMHWSDWQPVLCLNVRHAEVPVLGSKDELISWKVARSKFWRRSGIPGVHRRTPNVAVEKGGLYEWKVTVDKDTESVNKISMVIYAGKAVSLRQRWMQELGSPHAALGRVLTALMSVGADRRPVAHVRYAEVGPEDMCDSVTGVAAGTRSHTAGK